ncbi:MAG: hypothetical protein NTX26_03495 [Candidatus Parcubacteria bacterium]|nr:hypothetical protein [Candidatus Parcubacteria bacterium]
MKRFIVFLVIVALLALGVFAPRISAVEVPVKFYLNGEGVYTPADNIEVSVVYDVGMENIASIKGGLFDSQDLYIAGYPLYGRNSIVIRFTSPYLQRRWGVYNNGVYQLLVSVALRDGTAISFRKTVFISDNTVQFFFTQCCPKEDSISLPLDTYLLSSISTVEEKLSSTPGILYDGTITFSDGTSKMYPGWETGCLSAVYTYYTKTAEGYQVKIRFSQWFAQGRPSQALLDEIVGGAVEKYQKGEMLYDLCNPDQTLYGSGQISMWVWPPTK